MKKLLKEYFNHEYEARNDSRIQSVLMKEWLAWIWLYWCLIEMLYQSWWSIMRTECERIAFELHIEEDYIKKFVKSYKLFKRNWKSLRSESVKRRLGDRQEKSEKARASANSRRNANASETQCERNAIDKKSNKNKKSNNNIEFEKFRDLYNKKVWDKNKCKKKWDKLDIETQQKIIDILPSFLSTIKDKQFQPYPMTYLNNERWNDEIQDLRNWVDYTDMAVFGNEIKKDYQWLKAKVGKEKFFELKRKWIDRASSTGKLKEI